MMNQKLTLLKIYFSFKGRINRKTYWLMFVIPWILYFVLMPQLLRHLAQQEGTDLVRTGLVLTLLPMFWALLAVQSKRWHDSGKSGWLTLLVLIPGLGALVAIVNGMLAGDPNENKFGAPQT
ncbi:MAG: DUF805 domain-containing protein [bacterium]